MLKIDKLFMKEVANTALKLFAITLTVTLLLAVVNYFTGPVIEKNINSKATESMNGIFSNNNFTEITDKLSKKVTEINSVWVAKKDNKISGYCVNVTTQGYGGNVQMIIGVTLTGKVQSIKVVESSETPGIGTKVLNDEFLSGYKGYSAEAEKKIISGATITSNSVYKGVKIALDTVKAIPQEEVANNE